MTPSCRKVEPGRALSSDTGPLQVGARFLDKYEICEQIGHGGQAWVYRGRHIFSAREVAIKAVHSAQGMTPELLARGKAEARALGQLDHPNIVVMHDAGVTDEGLFYIVMELLRGRSLRAALTAHGRLSVPEVLELAIQAGQALQAAHEIKLLHRDLKPDNIYLTQDNRLKVLDFGIAKLLNELGFTTCKDLDSGSLLYMSPEQVQGLPLTARSDICALGLVMFEALLGQHPSLLLFERELSQRQEPYRRPTPADIPPIQMTRLPPLLSELDPDIPLAVAQVVQRALAKAAKDRFSTMSELVSALRVCVASSGQQARVALRGVEARDLSGHTPEPAQELPISQRTTLKCGRPWAAAAPEPTFAPATTPAITAQTSAAGESPPVTRVLKQSSAGRASARRVASTDTSRAARRVATASVRNAVIGGCLFGAALGSAGALAYFGPSGSGAPQAQAELNAPASSAVSTQAVVASLSPATAADTAEAAPARDARPVAAPSSVAARSASAPSAPSTQPAAAATLRATRASASELSATKPVTAQVGRAKPIHGGRPIYGE